MPKFQDHDFLDDDMFDDDEDTLKDRFLTFRIGQEDFGIEICHVTEIVNIPHITEVPDMPDFVKGVINLRGQVIPVMDVRTRFRLPPQAYNERTCVIVVSMNETQVGLIVDTVSEVLDIPAENISPPPAIARGGKGRYIQGMGRLENNVKILLDVNKLLFDEELAKLETIADSGPKMTPAGR